MKYFSIILFLSMLFLGIKVSAQTMCGTYNPTLYNADNYQKLLNRRPDDSSPLYRQSAVNKVIPVVFHVLFSEDDNNTSNQQVFDELLIVNDHFQHNNSNLSDVDSIFQDITGNANIEFRLARTDPDGECTIGINRVYSLSTLSATESIKNIVKWDPSKYLNIWVVKHISYPFSALAYSFLPDFAGIDDIDAGILIRSDQLGTTGTATATSDHKPTLTHELGHYFNLHHPWGPTPNPGALSNCNVDDGIADTPNTIGSNFCLNDTSCGSVNNEQNFMEYTDCPLMFTQGQALVMQNTLLYHDSGSAPRYNLWQDSNLIATGTDDDFNTTVVCPPNAIFRTDSKVICVGDEVQFEILELRGPISSYEWSSTKNITVIDPQNGIIKFNESGYYDLTLTVGNTEGNMEIEGENTMLCLDPTITEIPTYIEGFQGYSVTQLDGGQPWLTTPFHSHHWEVIASVSSDQDGKCLGTQTYIGTLTSPDGFSWLPPKAAELFSPMFDLSNETSNLKLYFDFAFKTIGVSTTQEFFIDASSDCGHSWSEIYKRDELDLLSQGLTFNTAPMDTNYNVNPWIPLQSEWEKIEIPMGSYAGKDQVLVRIRTVGIDGHYLYLDNFELTSNPLTIEEVDNQNIQIISTSGHFEIYLENENDIIESISIVDVVGKEVFNEISPNANTFSHNLKNGVYFIRMKVNSKYFIRKVILM